MGHLLEKQTILAFLCLCMSVLITSTRKEDLEKAAELAVERAAEKAAERAVEKSLEAGNKTSTTITVKESYSNARKIAEEQAAPGSESTRDNTGKTSIFESQDFPESPDYESPTSESDYPLYNDTRSENDYNDSGGYDHNESRGYADYNDSRQPDDYDPDYEEANDSKTPDNNDSVKNPKETNESENNNEFEDSRIPSDYDESSLDDVEEDYAFPKDTDYQKLNTSKPDNSEISETFGDFDSDFGSKLTNADAKLPDSSIEDDLKFDSPETDFLKKKDSSKNPAVKEEDEYKDDSWKSHSDWHKDFKSIGDESFPNGSFWDDDDESLKIWSEEEDTVSSDSKKMEAQAENQKSSDKVKSKEKSGSTKDFDFIDIKSWQDDDTDDNVPAADDVVETDDGDKNPNSKFYKRRSSRDDNYYRTGPVYTDKSTESDEDDEKTTERITTKSPRYSTIARSPNSRFRNPHRAKIQYQKIAGRSSENSRRNRLQNFSETNETEIVRRPYRGNYRERNETLENYVPYREILTTFRTYPKILDDKMVTKGPTITGNRSVTINPSIDMSSTQRNIAGNIQKILKRPSLVQLPPKLPTIANDQKDSYSVPSSVLTIPKSIPKEVIKLVYPHPYDLINFQTGQERIPRQKQQQLISDAQLPVFINTALPGPFQVAEKSPLLNNKPYAIRLDKSIPIALKRRMPFIVQFPLKPYEKQIRPDKKLSKLVENDSIVSENRLRKNRWSVA